jgi:6-phosphogluconolactonase
MRKIVTGSETAAAGRPLTLAAQRAATTLMVWLVLASVVFHFAAMSARGDSTKEPLQVYVGTYTGPSSQGIYGAKFDTTTGKLGAPELAAATKNPSFLAVHPSRRILYAVGELDNFAGQRAGAVSAFRIEANGGLTLLNQQPSGGTGPCHLTVDRSGRCVLVANYGSGSVAVLPITSDGLLGPPSATIQHHGSSINPQRQAGPHAHCIVLDPANRVALACDLGLDKVLAYRLNPARGTLVPNDPPDAALAPGSGPRHLAFAPGGRFVYVINELASTITAMEYRAKKGTLQEVQTVPTLPTDSKGASTCAEVQVHPSGKFVYGSNRGHDSIAVFAVDPKNGRLKLIEHTATGGKTPRHFALDPTGRWLLAENQDSNHIAVFSLDPATGRLKPTGQAAEIGAPVCVVFAP